MVAGGIVALQRERIRPSLQASGVEKTTTHNVSSGQGCHHRDEVHAAAFNGLQDACKELVLCERFTAP
jgi:Ni2+-binding GTPase involved in maturation of urease and hydrogenase